MQAQDEDRIIFRVMNSSQEGDFVLDRQKPHQAGVQVSSTRAVSLEALQAMCTVMCKTRKIWRRREILALDLGCS
jgi:hypothetical protein